MAGLPFVFAIDSDIYVPRNVQRPQCLDAQFLDPLLLAHALHLRYVDKSCSRVICP